MEPPPLSFCKATVKIERPPDASPSKSELPDRELEEISVKEEPFDHQQESQPKDNQASMTSAVVLVHKLPCAEVQTLWYEDNLFKQEAPLDNSAYVKVPDSEIEHITIKEEPAEWHQQPQVSDDLLDLMLEEGIYVEGFEEIDPIEKEMSIVAQDQFPAPSSSYSGARKKKRGHDETAQELLKLAVEKLSSIDCKEEKLDDIDYFLKSIAQDMRKMDLTNKCVAKKLISEVVFYGTLGSLKPSSDVNTN